MPGWVQAGAEHADHPPRARDPQRRSHHAASRVQRRVPRPGGAADTQDRGQEAQEDKARAEAEIPPRSRNSASKPAPARSRLCASPSPAPLWAWSAGHKSRIVALTVVVTAGGQKHTYVGTLAISRGKPPIQH